jgi:hypothetical protein
VAFPHARSAKGLSAHSPLRFPGQLLPRAKACSVPPTAANATRRARLSPQEGLSTAVRGTHRAFADAMSGLSARKDVRHRGLARYSAASPKAPYPDSPVCRSSAIDGHIMTAAAKTAPACLTILLPSGDGSRTPPCHPKCLSTPVNGVATARQRRHRVQAAPQRRPCCLPRRVCTLRRRPRFD